MSDNEELTTGDLANRIFKSITFQLENVLLMAKPESNVSSMIGNVVELIHSQNAALIEAYNVEIDATNKVIDQAESAMDESATLSATVRNQKQDITRLERELDELARVEAKTRVNMQQVEAQRDAYKSDLLELKKEHQKLQVDLSNHKNYKRLHTESKEKLKTNEKAINDKDNRFNTLLKKTKTMQKTALLVRESMLYEGLSPEKDFKIDEHCYYLYRRKLSISNTFLKGDGSEFDRTSRMHQFFFRLETSCGGHVDLIPLESGKIVVGKVPDLPDEISEYVLHEFEKETLFLPSTEPEFQTKELQALFCNLNEQLGIAS